MRNGLKLDRLLQMRFVKFGLVGGFGAVVNILTLLLAREWVFIGLPERQFGLSIRLDASLLLSISVSIVSNYIWNNLWTWKERADGSHFGFFGRLPKYIAASWFGVGVQFLAAKLLISAGVYYLLASAIAIVLASGINFVLNDRWTFGASRKNSYSNRTERLSEE
ncbi:GtrA family protein [Paraburkholderia tropica]|uniref:GtrA family protein n=1 Tax=Paraburkholderia tropica TaxID=92647 RepID=UPI002AB62B7E|nr:GtrA family protein [Paraburkholderia tropica]